MLLDLRPCANLLNSGKTLGRGTSSIGGINTSPKSTCKHERMESYEISPLNN